MRDTIDAGKFETVQRVRATTNMELSVIRARINDRAVAIATRMYDEQVQSGVLPNPRSVAAAAFGEVEQNLLGLLLGE